MADTYSKLLGLAETNTPAGDSEKVQPAQTPKQKAKKSPAQSTQKPAEHVKKPEIMKTRIHENDSPLDVPVKYSTLLRTQFIRKIKIHAAETDLKDYEVIELALTEFFKKK